MVQVVIPNNQRIRDIEVTFTPAEVHDALIAYAVANPPAEGDQIPADYAKDDDDAFEFSYKTASNFAPITIFNQAHNPAMTLTLAVNETD